MDTLHLLHILSKRVHDIGHGVMLCKQDDIALNKSSSYRDDDLKFEGFPCSVAAKMTRV